MRRRIIALLAAIGIGTAALLAAPTPASAHGVSQGNDYALHSYNGRVLTICDAENDGHRVWAGYYTSASYSYQTAPVIYGSNTSGVDCTTYELSHVLTNLRVVEDKPGSSSNYYGSWHGYPVAGT
ncbi:hypothetical protein [Verrucosispora sp. WMMD1129]|uniref:hypothetical protein n=1 Tax=Verrucosispora sp. WMMD1129 TaxID=3016093 RepID=UPI00249A8456|nr:hypothetical protein [Verrucosispora sp. WMMD1129]WFE43691.1 hypothetical protein O7624_04745 [Verrucosispora sp. WMMD1129]